MPSFAMNARSIWNVWFCGMGRRGVGDVLCGSLDSLNYRQPIQHIVFNRYPPRFR